MPNILSKQYQGLFHYAMIVLTFALAIVTNPHVTSLGYTWLAPVAAAIPTILIFLQKYTTVGDTPAPVVVNPAPVPDPPAPPA